MRSSLQICRTQRAKTHSYVIVIFCRLSKECSSKSFQQSCCAYSAKSCLRLMRSKSRNIKENLELATASRASQLRLAMGNSSSYLPSAVRTVDASTLIIVLSGSNDQRGSDTKDAPPVLYLNSPSGRYKASRNRAEYSHAQVPCGQPFLIATS